MDFVALDFETANATRASATSLALVVVRNSQVVDSFYTLINPETSFASQNVQINGISAAMVKSAPTWPTVWPHIQGFFTSNQLMVAHNASFDTSVLVRSLERYALPPAHFRVLDTVKVARHYLPNLPNHKLDTVSKALHIPLAHHHHALYDSYAAAQIALTAARQYGEAAVTGLSIAK